MHKVSIRFFNDREVRAVWDDAAAKWWFSVLDVVGALNGEPDYAKTHTRDAPVSSNGLALCYNGGMKNAHVVYET